MTKMMDSAHTYTHQIVRPHDPRYRGHGGHDDVIVYYQGGWVKHFTGYDARIKAADWIRSKGVTQHALFT